MQVVSVREGAVPGLIMLFEASSGLPTAVMSAKYTGRLFFLVVFV